MSHWSRVKYSPAFHRTFSVACTAAPKNKHKSSNWFNYSGGLLLYPAMPRLCCFLRQKTEMTKSSLRWGRGTFLPAHNNKPDVHDYLEAATRSICTVDTSTNPHLFSLITKQAQPMSSCFSLQALFWKVLLSTWDLLFIGLFRTCSEFKQWMYAFRGSVVLPNYLPCRT